MWKVDTPQHFRETSCLHAQSSGVHCYEECFSALLCFLLLTFYYFILSFFPSHDCVSFTSLVIPPQSFSPLFHSSFPRRIVQSCCYWKEILTAGKIIVYYFVCNLVTGGYLHLGRTTFFRVPERWSSSYESYQAAGVVTQSLQSGPLVQPYSRVQPRQLLWKDQNCIQFWQMKRVNKVICVCDVSCFLCCRNWAFLH